MQNLQGGNCSCILQRLHRCFTPTERISMLRTSSASSYHIRRPRQRHFQYTCQMAHDLMQALRNMHVLWSSAQPAKCQALTDAHHMRCAFLCWDSVAADLACHVEYIRQVMKGESVPFKYTPERMSASYGSTNARDQTCCALILCRCSGLMMAHGGQAL